jgi:hypothetical protein
MNMSALEGQDSHRSTIQISPTNAELAKKLEEDKIPECANEDKSAKVPKLNLD